MAHDVTPVVDIGPLFDPQAGGRDAIDRAIIAAAGDVGFIAVTGLQEGVPIASAVRRALLRFFDAPAALRHALASNTRDPSRPFRQRGWSAPREGSVSYYESFEIGPDVAHGAGVLDPADPLRRATPLPAEQDLPGWRAAVAAYYRHMEDIATVLMHALARGLGIAEQTFAAAFAGGNSALRLLRYPHRANAADAPRDTIGAGVISEAHVDLGFVTLLTQDGVEGLQARTRDGWRDVPPREGSLVVNFGALLERWTGGRVRATEHRVLSPGRERRSLPFFYEPRLDADIASLPIAGTAAFAPFRYGDYFWSAIPRYRRLFGER
jgi:isopenicillin N synthase-like dioxygenase